MKLNKNSSDEELNRMLTNDGVLELYLGVVSSRSIFSAKYFWYNGKADRHSANPPPPLLHVYMHMIYIPFFFVVVDMLNVLKKDDIKHSIFVSIDHTKGAK